MLRTLQFFAVLFTAVTMAAGWAHLLELPNKIVLSQDDYFTVQQIYRGWALLGFVLVGALVITAGLAWLQRRQGIAFYFAVVAAVCIAIGLAVFLLFTFPANQATQNWTVLPPQWEELRRQWEYSHATGAVLYFVALVSITLSILSSRR